MYFPKSQIKTNLKANPGEFITLEGKNAYSGFYWRTSTGQFFSGKNPNDTPTLELIPDTFIQSEDSRFEGITNVEYSELKNIDKTVIPQPPKYNLNIPNDEDYNLGSYLRYFAKKNNQSLYIEINNSTYEGLINQNPQLLFNDYMPFSLTWTLVGESKEQVETINRNSVAITERKMKAIALSNYFKNYSQFYQA